MHHYLLFTIAKYSLLEAFRDRIFILIILGNIILFSISLFVGELAIAEREQTQVAILAFIIRLFSIFIISLFVITSILREFNDKGFELILSHSVTRASYYLGKILGFSIIALLIALLSSIALISFSPIETIFLWGTSLYLELLIVINLSMLCLISFNSITISFIVVVAFYFLCRSIEVIQLISNSPIMALGSTSHQFINFCIDLIAKLLPNLNQFTRTEWLVYGVDGNQIVMILGQTVIYSILLSCFALFDFYRKEL